MENLNNSERIDALLNGKLSTTERAAFQEEMAKDANLEQDVKTHTLEREAIKLLLKEDYKAQIKAWRTEGSATTTLPSSAKERTLQPKARTRSLRPMLSAAASILLLLVAGFWFSNANYSGNAIASDAYTEAGSITDRSGNVQLDKNVQQGLQAYFSEQDYDGAIRSFEQAGNSVDANYYLGHSHFKLKQYGEAVSYFNQVLAATTLPSYINRSQLEYNRLLAQIGAGDTGSTFEQNLAQLIQNGQPPFNTKAQALKDKMGSFWRNLAF